MPLKFFDQDIMFPALLVLLVPLLILLTMLKIFLGDIQDIPHLNTYFFQSHLIVMMQLLFVLS